MYLADAYDSVAKNEIIINRVSDLITLIRGCNFIMKKYTISAIKPNHRMLTSKPRQLWA